jgi:hypothetical protein
VIRDTREKYSRLEEEQTLDVQGPLVVEEPRPAGKDQFRHDDRDDCVGIGR